MFFAGVWIVGYAPSIVRTVKVMPIFAALAGSPAASSGRRRRVSAISSTFLHSAAPHVPSFFVSYFEPFSAAFAFATLPWSPGVLYGL